MFFLCVFILVRLLYMYGLMIGGHKHYMKPLASSECKILKIKNAQVKEQLAQLKETKKYLYYNSHKFLSW